MILTLKELADYLRVNERTILRMINEGKLQGSKIGGQWRFNSSQIDSLFFPNEVGMNEEVMNEMSASNRHLPLPLSRTINENQMILDMKANSVETAICAIAHPSIFGRMIMDLPEFQQRLLDREKLLSTGIGSGIAIPHPRDPETGLRRPAVLVYGRCKDGVDFNALDGKPVKHFFLLACQTIETHLHLMASLAQMLKQEDFIPRCEAATSTSDILKLIMEKEHQQIWKNPTKAE